MKIPSLAELYSQNQKETWGERHRITKKFGGDFPRTELFQDQGGNFSGLKVVKIFCSERHRKIRNNKIAISLKEYFESRFCYNCYRLTTSKGGKGNGVLD